MGLLLLRTSKSKDEGCLIIMGVLKAGDIRGKPRSWVKEGNPDEFKEARTVQELALRWQLWS